MSPIRRHLTMAEIDLWLAVTAGVAPRAGARLPPRPPPRAGAAPPDKPTPMPLPAPPVPQAPASTRLPGKTLPSLAPLEKGLRRKLAAGRSAPDGVIDLHGMTQAEAHRALGGYLRDAAGRGGRLVLVVTGKGRGGAGESGVLRRVVPHWLRDDGLRGVVMGFEEAAQPHGGFGALYVRLRRPRLG